MEYKSKDINELAGALAKAQGKMKSAVKDSENPYFNSKYADLASVIDAIREPLSSNGLSYIQPIVCIDGQTYLETILIHKSGQWIKSLAPIHVNNASRNPMQAFGAAISYLRRYELSALVGITQDDDDGESARGVYPTSTRQTSHTVEKISTDQVNKILDKLNSLDQSIVSNFWQFLSKNKITRIEDLPAAWYESSLQNLDKIIADYNAKKEVENE